TPPALRARLPGELCGELGLALRTGSRVLGRLREKASSRARNAGSARSRRAARPRSVSRPRRGRPPSRPPRPRAPPPGRPAGAPPIDFEQEDAAGVSGLDLLIGVGLAGTLALLEYRRPVAAVRTRPDAEPRLTGAPRGGSVVLESGQVVSRGPRA